MILIPNKSISQEILWSNTYPAGAESHGYSIKNSKEGGFYVGGSASISAMGKNIYILKIDANGDTIWTKNIGGTANDEASCIVVTEDSGCIVAGYSQSYGNGSADFFIVKLNKNGSIQWTRTNGGALDDKSYSVISTMDGGYLVTGYTTSSGAGGKDIKVVKISSAGNVQWTQTIGGIYNESAYSACQMYDSSYVIAGTTNSFGATDQDIYLLKLDTRGDTLWTKVYAKEGSDYAYSIYACEESGFVVAGKTNGTPNENYDMLLMKFFDDGYLIWKKTYGNGKSDDVAYDVKETISNEYILAGSSVNNNDTDVYVVSISDQGDLVEEFKESITGFDESRSLCINMDNSFAIVGTKNVATTPSILVDVMVTINRSSPRGLWVMNCWRFDSHKGTDPHYPNTVSYILVDDDVTLTNHKDASVKINELVQYCVLAKIHTVVLGHLEDVLREDNSFMTFTDYPTSSNYCNNPADGAQIRTNLKLLLTLLHQNGITVYAQWIDDRTGNASQGQGVYHIDCGGLNWNSSYNYDDEVPGGSSLHTGQEFSAFINFNSIANNPLKAERFDGIMLDYEYFTEEYGNHPSKPYGYAKAGYQTYWTPLANSYLTARTNHLTTGVDFVQCYLNQIIFTSENQIANNIFDITSPSGTDVNDSRQEHNEIDNLGFDALVIQCSIDDIYDPTTHLLNEDPTAFLGGNMLLNSKESSNQRNRYRFELFGNNLGVKATQVIPYFQTLNKDLSVTNACGLGVEKAFVGDVLLGHCTWNASTGIAFPTIYNVNPPASSFGVHYLPSIEYVFLQQFYTGFGIVTNGSQVWAGGIHGNQNDPQTSYGDCKLDYGFYFFQYGMGAAIDPKLEVTSLGSIQNRPGDQHNSIYSGIAMRQQNPHIFNNQTDLTFQSAAGENSFCKLFPNPIITESELLCNGTENPTQLTISDAMGKDVSSKFAIDYSNGRIKLKTVSGKNGIYILSFTDNNEVRKHIYFSINN